MNLKDVLDILKGKAAFTASLGFIIPLIFGALLGISFGLSVMETVFLSLCLSITALPVSIRILESFGMTSTEVGKFSVATAIFSDIFALMALGVVLDLPNKRGIEAFLRSLSATSGRLLLFASVIFLMDFFIQHGRDRGIRFKRIPEKIVDIFGTEALFGLTVGFVLLFSSLSESLGFHFVIGAFFGALILNREFFLASRFKQLEKTISSVTGGFLAPVFFAYLGLEFTIDAFSNPTLLVSLLLVLMSSKILSGFLGGKILKLSNQESLSIGFILNSRGTMDLVVASIALQKGYIEQDLFSALVFIAIVSTILTPILVKKFAKDAIPLQTKTQSI